MAAQAKPGGKIVLQRCAVQMMETVTEPETHGSFSFIDTDHVLKSRPIVVALLVCLPQLNAVTDRDLRHIYWNAPIRHMGYVSYSLTT